jgi:hypothetical protein
VFRDGTIKPFDLKSKVEVANDIVTAIEGLIL